MQQNFEGLAKGPANYVPLTPISFLTRTAGIFPDRDAVIYGETRYGWGKLLERCHGVASALQSRGIERGDVVSVLLPNIPQMLECHYAVPMAGAVLNTINVRLEAETVAYILDHSDCKLLIADTAFAGLVRAAFEIMGREIPVIDVADISDDRLGDDYEDLAGSGGRIEQVLPNDEWDPIALNYTSGTSGRPKGVVYHHRGAYLMSMGTLPPWQVPMHPVYLSVVPMFHCNGWNHPWAIAVQAGTFVFTRDPMPALIFKAIKDHGVSHFGGAPIVLQMLTDADEKPDTPFEPPINVFTAGAPPPPAILEKTKAMGLNVMQVYGLTETYGHVTQCVWREEWDGLGATEQADLQARQGVSFPMMEHTIVVDRESGAEVPHDGETQGEIVMRGNAVMSGYYKNPEATKEAFKDGWFWSGDAAVVHPQGYIQIKDRLKDVIISGGENISSVEVEGVLYRHPAVAAAAVVAKADEKWGEVPCACVELKPGEDATEDDLDQFCRQHLAGFKRPKAFILCELPKTSTGKIQKFKLRDMVAKS